MKSLAVFAESNIGNVDIADIEMVILDASIGYRNAYICSVDPTFRDRYFLEKLGDFIPHSVVAKFSRFCPEHFASFDSELAKLGVTRFIVFSDISHMKDAPRSLAILQSRYAGSDSGVDVSIIPLMPKKYRFLEPVHNPVVPLFWLGNYKSAIDGFDHMSDLIRRMKYGQASADEIETIAGNLMTLIASDVRLQGCDGIVAMPRRVPGGESDLQPLVDMLGGHREMRAAPPNWLSRIQAPPEELGEIMRNRRRYPADVHAATMRVTGPTVYRKVLLVDNVITTGGSMMGAIRAIQRDTNADIACVSILRSI